MVGLNEGHKILLPPFYNHGKRNKKDKKMEKEKVKTLEDIEDQIVIFGNSFKVIPIDELKEEAKKWIFSLTYKTNNDEVANWIKHFFNIEEEELTK